MNAPAENGVTAVVAGLRRRIEGSGPLSFVDFMGEALYGRGTGYYERAGGGPGRSGDFVTSVTVGPLFGELWALVFSRWGESMAGEPLRIAEAGGHDGRLAADILGWLARERPALYEAVDYVLIDSSPARGEWQRRMLDAHRSRVRWVSGLEQLGDGSGSGGWRGILFSNEFLDALPFHRVGWDAVRGEWFEWRVGWSGGGFCWERGRPDGRLAGSGAWGWLTALPEALRSLLPDGFTTEVGAEAERWWGAACEILESGWLVAVDYGLESEEFLMPGREGGVGRAYWRHRRVSDLLARPGEQDLTASVWMGVMRAIGERSGLVTERDVSQGRYLGSVMASRLGVGRAGGLDAERLRQFQTLTHPEGFGSVFRVLIQRRDGG